MIDGRVLPPEYLHSYVAPGASSSTYSRSPHFQFEASGFRSALPAQSMAEQSFPMPYGAHQARSFAQMQPLMEFQGGMHGLGTRADEFDSDSEDDRRNNCFDCGAHEMEPEYEEQAERFNSRFNKRCMLKVLNWACVTALMVSAVVLGLVAYRTLKDEDFRTYSTLAYGCHYGKFEYWYIFIVALAAITFILAGCSLCCIRWQRHAKGDRATDVKAFMGCGFSGGCAMLIVLVVIYFLNSKASNPVFETANLICQDRALWGCHSDTDNTTHMQNSSDERPDSGVAATAKWYLISNQVPGPESMCGRVQYLCEPPFGLNTHTACMCNGLSAPAPTTTVTTMSTTLTTLTTTITTTPTSTSITSISETSTTSSTRTTTSTGTTQTTTITTTGLTATRTQTTTTVTTKTYVDAGEAREVAASQAADRATEASNELVKAQQSGVEEDIKNAQKEFDIDFNSAVSQERAVLQTTGQDPLEKVSQKQEAYLAALEKYEDSLEAYQKAFQDAAGKERRLSDLTSEEDKLTAAEQETTAASVDAWIVLQAAWEESDDKDEAHADALKDVVNADAAKNEAWRNLLAAEHLSIEANNSDASDAAKKAQKFHEAQQKFEEANEKFLEEWHEVADKEESTTTEEKFSDEKSSDEKSSDEKSSDEKSSDETSKAGNNSSGNATRRLAVDPPSRARRLQALQLEDPGGSTDALESIKLRLLMPHAPAPWQDQQGAYCDYWSKPEGGWADVIQHPTDMPWCFVSPEIQCGGDITVESYTSVFNESMTRSNGPCIREQASSSQPAQQGHEATYEALWPLGVTAVLAMLAAGSCGARLTALQPRKPPPAKPVDVPTALRFEMAEREVEFLVDNKTPVDLRLRLYGLHKQAHHGNVEKISLRPAGSVHDKKSWEAQKWDAWKSCRNMSDEQAMLEYIRLVDRLKARAEQQRKEDQDSDCLTS